MNFLTGNFFYNGKPLTSAPLWGMSVLESGNMRFRWNETNSVREKFFSLICAEKRKALQPELIHSKTIYEVSSADEIFKKKGDGILTSNKFIVPAVTVADCMPVFVYDKNSNVFGVLHSGWKGTGIAAEAFYMLNKKYGSKPDDLCFILGPHINSCCYSIDKSRAEYFSENFGSCCVSSIDGNKYSLSLTDANLYLLRKIGIPDGNIFVSKECTCCFKENGAFKYGSFRRQTSSLPQDLPLEEKQKHFTVQAAFVFYSF